MSQKKIDIKAIIIIQTISSNRNKIKGQQHSNILTILENNFKDIVQIYL